MKIKVLITGGTIDGLDKDSRPAEEKYTLVPDLLRKMQPAPECSLDIVMIKDSSLITDEDRKIIADRAKNSEEQGIVITHGTDTMVQTAKYLDKQQLNKTIVLTGSFIPANKEKSDALSNLESALKAAQTLPAGVYVAMSDGIFNADNVRKNFDTKTFEEETPAGA